MFVQCAKEMAGDEVRDFRVRRHCEERSDEAIHSFFHWGGPDLFLRRLRSQFEKRSEYNDISHKLMAEKRETP